MNWVFLSPHFDDAVYSCGGLIWDLFGANEHVEIWTVCSGSPPAGPLTPFARELHKRWRVDRRRAIAVRKSEDKLACQRLRARSHYFGIPDCIYRLLPGGVPLVAKEEDLWQPLHPGEDNQLNQLVEVVYMAVRKGARLVSPLGLGQHVDHTLTRRAAELAAGDRPDIQLAYYADFPYVMKVLREREEFDGSLRAETTTVSPTGLQAWGDGIALYASQLSSFWKGEGEMRSQLADYVSGQGGFRLYWNLNTD